MSNTRAERCKILIVNDDTVVLRAIVHMLRDDEYQLYEATTGAEGWELAQQHQPDLIILDMVLPDIQGDELCHRIKAEPSLNSTLVIFFSSVYTNADQRADGLNLGADGYLTWPMSSREFRAYMQTMVRLQNSESTLRKLNVNLEQRVQQRTTELTALNAELEQFVYIASHDLRAPLRSISHLAEWIAQDIGVQMPAPVRKHLDKLQARVTRLDRLIDDLLLYLNTGRQRYERRSVDVATLLQAVCTELTLPSGGEVNVAQSLPTLHIEKRPLQIVFQQLIENAFKHHPQPECARVQITVEQTPEQTLFVVADNGPGIDPKYHTRIFQVCQTLQPRDVVEGSGMGLAIAKRLVERHGGTIEVAPSTGQGATFRFTWPRKEETHR